MSKRSIIEIPPDAPPEVLNDQAASIIFEMPAPPSALARLRDDRAFQVLLALAFVFNLALLGYLAARFEVLPDPIPLHFDSAGFPDRIEAKSGIFGLPIIGTIIFGVNVALGLVTHQWQRAAALLIAASALLVQVLMWSAVLSIVGGIY